VGLAHLTGRAGGGSPSIGISLFTPKYFLAIALIGKTIWLPVLEGLTTYEVYRAINILSIIFLHYLAKH